MAEVDMWGDPIPTAAQLVEVEVGVGSPLVAAKELRKRTAQSVRTNTKYGYRLVSMSHAAASYQPMTRFSEEVVLSATMVFERIEQDERAHDEGDGGRAEQDSGRAPGDGGPASVAECPD